MDLCGQVLDGRYELLSILDRGGQGIVYRARDSREGDLVAVKMLKPEHVADANSRERLLREAQALVTLAGTCAVRVLDLRWWHGSPCVVMELLEGADLDRVLSDTPGPMPLARVLPLLAPVVETLQTAHDRGIVHRDLKPGNLFLTNANQIRLLDFGYAKFVRMLSLTAAGSAAGSPSYMAPEIWNGASIDRRIDIYSFGVLVFRMLSGQLPFAPGNLAVLWKAATTAPRPSLHALRPELPPEIDAWVEQAMAIDPERRFLQIRAAWRALCAVVGHN